MDSVGPDRGSWFTRPHLAHLPGRPYLGRSWWRGTEDWSEIRLSDQSSVPRHQDRPRYGLPGRCARCGRVNQLPRSGPTESIKGRTNASASDDDHRKHTVAVPLDVHRGIE